MGDEPPSKSSKFFPYLLDFIALAFVFGFVDALIAGREWYVSTGCLASAVVLLFIAFRWDRIGVWMSDTGRGTRRMELIVLVAVLAVGVTSGYDYYDRHYVNALKEFDDPQSAPVTYYGHSATDCHATVNGDFFWRYRNDYRIAVACFLYDPAIDLMQSRLIVGNTHSIAKGSSTISATHKPFDFTGSLVVVILMVPKTVQIQEFSTVGQARSLKVKLIGAGSQTNE